MDKRYVRYDNSLVISAFKAHEFEPEIHSTVYKCQASNSVGTIVSRDVVISAGKCGLFLLQSSALAAANRFALGRF